MGLLDFLRKRPSPSGLYVPVNISDIIHNTLSKPKIKHTHIEITGIVQEVKIESDRDHHVWVSDGKYRIACEIIPELKLPLPKVGSKVIIRGILRYDYEHSWWELHPIVNWKSN